MCNEPLQRQTLLELDTFNFLDNMMQTEEEIPQLPNIRAQYVPKEPVSRIHEQRDIETFMKSEAFDRIMTFVMLLNKSVMQKKISDACYISPVSLYNRYSKCIIY